MALPSQQITLTLPPNNRYWVGGASSWNGTAGSKWAYSSGGTAGAPEPTAKDNVFFDANSGAVTVTITTTTAKCSSLNFTGFTGTLAGSTALNISGSLTLSTGMTLTYTGGITFDSSGNSNITTNGKTLLGVLTFNGTGSWTIQDNLTSTANKNSFSSGINLTSGTITANNVNITIAGFTTSSGTASKTLNMGSGTWTLNGNTSTPWIMSGSPTINANTSTIKMTSSGATFQGASLSYYNVHFNSSSGTFTVSGSNTFNNLRIDPNLTTSFVAGTTQTFTGITPLTCTGTAGNIIIIQALTAANFNIISANNITTDYLNISRCQFFGGGIWNAGANSIDGGNNTGITFP